MSERKKKIDLASAAASSGDFATAKKLASEVFRGDSNGGRQAELGMTGSLLYHIAMVNKMATEPKLILEELKIETPNIERNLKKFYWNFCSDAKELAENILQDGIYRLDVKADPFLQIKDIPSLVEKTTRRIDAVEDMLDRREPRAETELQSLFQSLTRLIVDMRLRQEFETISGFLIVAELAKELGKEKLTKTISNVQTRFGNETVKDALGLALKTGMQREKLQGLMLSDHYIEYQMNMEKLEGIMRFLNCPIFGSHNYIAKELKISDDATSLFCRHFCLAHAKSMLETVLPFTFELSQPKRMAENQKCEFFIKLARAPTAALEENYIPLVVSWNVTLQCNLKCRHCYINAGEKKTVDELSTDASKMLLHQIAEVSRPLLILSGGEPLLRSDIFELIRYGKERGLKMALGSNGLLIDDKIARRLKDSGIATVSISLDSSIPERHDEFRGLEGAWENAVEGIKALRKNDILTQINTTVTKENYNEIDAIMLLAEKLGVENFHLFFLVPTGRGTKIDDVSPEMYEEMIKTTFAKGVKHKLNVKPSCAPQFMRIAKEMGVDVRRWIRGCVAGLYYCRIYPTGEVTPCPYLPIKLGNIREESFSDIWFNSDVLKSLRDCINLKGKCRICGFNDVCGGCRARAYGLTSEFTDFCGNLHEPTELTGDYLAEDPWCAYKPKARD